MWGYEEFIAKAQLYFDRAANHDQVDDEFVLWHLLGLEFLLRAPLAQLHPSLLAQPEGNSLLHAAGIVKADAHPKSVMTKTVVDRLKFIVAGFGDDRQRDAIFLSNLRNSELHTAEATLANIPEEQWLPRFLAVADAICEHLQLPVTDLLEADLVTHARKLTIEADKAVERSVKELIANSKYLYSHLTAAEVQARMAAARLSPTIVQLSDNYVECPACGNPARLKLTPGRTTKTRYDDADSEIIYSVVNLAEELDCKICGLRLNNTGQVTAAGIPRLHTIVHTEDRYEGWEDAVDTSSLQESLMSSYDGGDDYGND